MLGGNWLRENSFMGKDEWQSMETAPKDGRQIQLRIRHYNWRYEQEDRWQEDVIGEWINHNGGGWMWKGIMGEPVAWRDAFNRS